MVKVEKMKDREAMVPPQGKRGQTTGKGREVRKKTAGKWQKCSLVSGKASVASDMGWL